MPNPRELSPSGVDIPAAPLHEAEILDDASAPGEEVRCVIPASGAHLATDPMPWTPYVTPAGFFYPKRGDRAVIADPEEGPPVISQWWPEATKPDVSL